MAMRRYPFDLFDDMERLFDQMRHSMWDTEPRPRFGTRGGMAFELDTNLSLEPTDDGYVVLADLPGFETDEIDLRFDDGSLTVSATHEVKDGGYARSRRVRESVSIPGDVIVEDVEASYRNGVLEVHLPTGEDDEEGGHRIDID